MILRVSTRERNASDETTPSRGHRYLAVNTQSHLRRTANDTVPLCGTEQDSPPLQRVGAKK